MLQPLEKLKLYTKLSPETVHKYSHHNLFLIICKLPGPTKVFLQLEHHIQLLPYLLNQYQE